jgi:ABC-2 type transport system ATP-binding protein
MKAVKINGQDIFKEALKAKMQFGFVPDDPNIFSRLTGIEYLNFMADIYGVSSEIRLQRMQELLTRFEMSSAVGDLIQSYSHGMKQKIVIIGALLHDPPVWILDEPLTGLDPRSSFDLKKMMREHAESGKTVFFSTHVLDVAEKVCDRLAIINKGKVVFCGSMEEIREHAQENQSLEKLFLELTENV